MYVRRELEKVINERLFRDILPNLPELKEDLPFKDVTEAKVQFVADKVRGIDSNLDELLNDVMEVVIAGDDYVRVTTTKSSLCKSLCVTMLSKSRRVEVALNNSSLTTQEVARTLMNIDKDACVVGGCVRDAIIGQEPKDWDFVSGLDYDTLEWHFTQKGFKSKETGKQFLVLNVSKGGEDFEIACFRTDGTYLDGRRPESVEVGDIESDSMRRDFSVNALYFRLSDGILLDPTGHGIKDILDMKLRFVGKPKDRLTEDSIRAYRFYRFIDRGFEPESKSLKAVRDKLQEESKLLSNLKTVLTLPGVKEIVDAEAEKRNSPKMVKMGKLDYTHEELLSPISNIERVRLEIEKMVGV
jgi:hypothetical protein